MVKSSPYLIISILYIGLFLGCAGVSPDQYRDLRVSAGEANLGLIPQKVQRILDYNLFEIIRLEESPASIIWETAWKGRAPFNDERAQGIVEAQTKLIIMTRQKTGSGSQALHRVHITAQNMVRFGSEEDWIRIPNTREYSSYIRKIAYDLKSELDMTQRVFD